MKHWKKERHIVQENAIILKKEDRVLRVVKFEGKIYFEEACDDYYEAEYSKEEALELLEELKEWINN